MFIINHFCLRLLLVGLAISNTVAALRSDGSGHLEFSLKHEEQMYYATTLDIGTPSQQLTVLFDTGSADFWVMDSSNPFCLAKSNTTYYQNATYNGSRITPSVDCSSLSTYNENSSSTYQDLDNGRFYIIYADGTFADGSWGKETMSIDGIKIHDIQFGLAKYATTPVSGVLGIGFPRRESVKGYDGAPNEYYPNFPQILKSEHIIDVVAYSLFLNSPDSDTGSIVFGAIDESKFSGDLYTFPMVNEYPTIVDVPATLAMTIQGLGAQNKSSCEHETFMTTKYPVLLDSGTSLLNAPKSIADKMASFVNASYSADEGIYILDCPDSTDGVEYTFDFGDLQINVPLTSLILSPETEGGYCGFAVQPTNDSMVLGDVFLSSAYVVFDLDNYKVSLAQANWNASDDSRKLVNIPTDGSIPGGKSATAQPWSTNDPFTVTSDIYASDVCKTTLSSHQQTGSSSIPQTSMQALNSTTRVVGVRSTTTLSKTTQTGVTNQGESTNIESATARNQSAPNYDAKSSDSGLIIVTESSGRKGFSSPTHSMPQTTVNPTATKSSALISISVGKSINRPTHKTIITETVTKYSTVVINVCKPTF
ncbi:aspartyl protease BAR1 [Saccharomyces eubayanus]|uniref:aspartyl protease BAR1 n=1 Tax=Saccharomyces eubayanus TaxID=1080349 RepID=UPI0006C31DF2|nr:BAR1-like protein [Saccharomyces eubayanus]KOG98874.1 BAR1-like protein [Saccharomyces eubayanus]